MKLSEDQVDLFWSLWKKSCIVMRWTRADGMSAKEIDANRKEFLKRCGFSSLTLVDRMDGFTKVKNELLVLQGVSLKAAQETIDPALNRARVLRHHILTDLVPCLELYLEDVRAYMTKIMQDKNRWWKIDRPECDMTLMDLSADKIPGTDRATGEVKEYPSQLEQLQYTLSARLNDLRNQAGDSLHDMRTKAGLECACAKCRTASNLKPFALALAGLPAEPDQVDAPF